MTKDKENPLSKIETFTNIVNVGQDVELVNIQGTHHDYSKHIYTVPEGKRLVVTAVSRECDCGWLTDNVKTLLPVTGNSWSSPYPMGAMFGPGAQLFWQKGDGTSSTSHYIVIGYLAGSK